MSHRPTGFSLHRAVWAPPAEHLLAVADYYKKSGGPVHGKRRIESLKLSATDADWTTGLTPAAVRGRFTAMSLNGYSGALRLARLARLRC